MDTHRVLFFQDDAATVTMHIISDLSEQNSIYFPSVSVFPTQVGSILQHFTFCFLARNCCGVWAEVPTIL